MFPILRTRSLVLLLRMGATGITSTKYSLRSMVNLLAIAAAYNSSNNASQTKRIAEAKG